MLTGGIGSRRRLRVRTESGTSIIDSEFGLAPGIGWGGAWDVGTTAVPVPAVGSVAAGGDGGRGTPVPTSGYQASETTVGGEGLM